MTASRLLRRKPGVLDGLAYCPWLSLPGSATVGLEYIVFAWGNLERSVKVLAGVVAVLLFRWQTKGSLVGVYRGDCWSSCCWGCGLRVVYCREEGLGSVARVISSLGRVGQSLALRNPGILAITESTVILGARGWCQARAAAQCLSWPSCGMLLGDWGAESQRHPTRTHHRAAQWPPS